MCVPWLLYQLHSHFSPLFKSPYSLRHNIEIRLINNPTMASVHSSERKSCMSLILNQNLEIIKFGKEGMPKTKIG